MYQKQYDKSELLPYALTLRCYRGQIAFENAFWPKKKMLGQIVCHYKSLGAFTYYLLCPSMDQAPLYYAHHI